MRYLVLYRFRGKTRWSRWYIAQAEDSPGFADRASAEEVYGRFRPTEDDAARWEAIAAAKDAEEAARRKA